MKIFSDIYEKKVDVVQRKKQARRMSRLAQTAGFQRKKKRSQLRVRDIGKLTVIAKKKVVQQFRDKFYPEYKSMGLQQRVVVDQRIQQKYGKKIAKLTKKLVVKLKAAEAERVAKAKGEYQQ